jgi:pyrimidine operon attenuation protein / uracil phosphoribosyltransferase
MPEPRIRRAVRRMAMQIFEKSREDARQSVLVGLNQRGYALALLIAGELAEIAGHPFVCVPYHIHPSDGNPTPELGNAIATVSHLIVVDDVLFSGRTMMQAIREIMQMSSPDTLRLAVLIDRGHRKYPIQPDFVGLLSPTKLREHVEVHFDSDLQPLGVFLSDH